MKKILFLTLLVFGRLGIAQVNFDVEKWEDAINLSKSENKLIFLYAYTTWSEPCQLLEKYTFTDLEVANFYNDNFVKIRLNVEQYPGIELAEDYNIDIYPSVLFIDASEQLIHQGCGAMDAGDFLELGKTALGDQNYYSLNNEFLSGVSDQKFMIKFLDMMEENCLDVEGLAAKILKQTKLNELINEIPFLLMEGYQWDIFSREFQYLQKNKEQFERSLGKERVNDKIFNTYLAQYQEIYEAEELHLFGMRAILNELSNTSFIGSDTLQVMMDLHYYEISEDWEPYAESAIDWVGMAGLNDPEELSDIAWKFYLFVGNKEQLKIAAGWANEVIDTEPSPSNIDTYASLLYKLGEKKQAIELEKQAIQMAEELLEDVAHYQYQLEKFQKKD